MNTFTKVALAAVGTIAVGGGLFAAAPSIADTLNPNVVPMEMGGNVDCKAGTYRAESGSKLATILGTRDRHSFEAVGAAFDQLAGPVKGGFLMLGVAAQVMETCDITAPVAAAPAPVAPPVVAPVAQSQTYTGYVTFNGKSEKATITRFNNDSSFRVTWTDGHEVTYTLVNGFSVKLEVASRGGVVTSYGSWNNKTGDLVVTTDNGTTIIPNA